MTKNRTILLVLLTLVFLSFTAQSCEDKDKGTYIQTVYKTMVTSAVVYDTTMKTIADLYSQGKVSESFKEDSIRYGTAYWQGYHKLQEALEKYVSGSVEKSVVDDAKAEFDSSFSEFTTHTEVK